ncbi:MAG TPA: hypothetical protein VFE98_08625 [Candidatus Bathyarchaeia archaeon]|nr:hypothetical protein [Candidatus Bathyarchaeia archaeon]
MSHVTDTIQSKVRALGGAMAVLGGTGLFVTNLAEQFGYLDKKTAQSLDRTFAFIAAAGMMINVLARLAPMIMAAASAQSIMNAATAVANALAGPLGWAILAGAVTALTAYALSQNIGANKTVQNPSNAAGGYAPGTTAATGPITTSLMPISSGGGNNVSANITITGSSSPEQTAAAVKRHLEILIDRERLRRG